MIQIVVILALAALIGWAVWKSVKKARRGGGCCDEHEETIRRTGVSDRKKKHYPYTTTLAIGGMTCDNCARRVENALNGLDGVWASVSIAEHQAKVRCREVPDRQAMAKAVAAAGYVVTDV